jgi:hypothetical protein
MPISSELEALFVNNLEFRQIQAHLARFNPIKVMQAAQSEIRNSSILAWLLDPNENHGLGDDFLKAFLAGALKAKSSHVSALQILSADFSDVEIRTEHNPDINKKTRIDILIDCPRSDWLFIIENKLGSTQSEQQLRKYYDSVRSRLDREDRRSTIAQGIYLTLDGEDPSADVSENFVSYSHQQYAEQLAYLMAQKRDSLAAKIVDFIEYFIEVVMENSPLSPEDEQRMQELAKRLYREHRRVIDYIVQHGSRTVLNEAFSQLVGGDIQEKTFIVKGIELKVVRGTKRWLSFIPIEWLNLLDQAKQCLDPPSAADWPGCENWRLPFPIGFWVELREGAKGFRVTMAMEVGPLSHHKQRVSLINAIEAEAKAQRAKVSFSPSAKEQRSKYSIFKSVNLPTKNEDNPDDLSKDLATAIYTLAPDISIVTKAMAVWVSNIKEKGWDWMDKAVD